MSRVYTALLVLGVFLFLPGINEAEMLDQVLRTQPLGESLRRLATEKGAGS